MIYDTISNLELNLKFFLDIVFLKDGHFTNIPRGKTIRNRDASKLVLDISAASDIAGVSGAQVWQSPFQNWVYESGITLNAAPYISGLTPPIIVSGIWVNGTFFANGTAVSGHRFDVDYINGRVVFSDSGLPSNSNIQASYSYKTYRIDFTDGEEAQETLTDYAETALKDNPLADNVIVYPSGDIVTHTFPAIYIEVGPMRPERLELGNRSMIEGVEIFLHAYALNRWDRNVANELLKNRIYLNSYLVDFNYAPLPLSGLVNTLSPVYIPFQTLLENPTVNGNKVISWTYSIEDGESRRLPPDGPYFKGVTTYDVRIWNIAPTGRIPVNPYIG